VGSPEIAYSIGSSTYRIFKAWDLNQKERPLGPEIGARLLESD
jgi:hypothetical protein